MSLDTIRFDIAGGSQRSGRLPTSAPVAQRIDQQSVNAGEILNLAELQATLADAENWRMKDRLTALIGLAKGGDAETVARSNAVHLETLRNWAKRYRRSGVEGLLDTRPERDGRPSRLSPEQRGILTEWIVAQLEIDEDELCARVKTRFGRKLQPGPHEAAGARGASGNLQRR